MEIKRGDLFCVGLDTARGSEQAGRRPVLVIQNDVGNELAATTMVASLTTRKFSVEYSINVLIPKGTGGLKEDSTALLSQIHTIDKTRLERKIGCLADAYMKKVNEAIKISLAL